MTTTPATHHRRRRGGAPADRRSAMNRDSIPAELGTRMLAAGVAYEIQRATGRLPARRTRGRALACLASWGLVVAILAAILAAATY